VIETLGFERTSVLGWSMGGFIAQTLALQHPDRVNKLILLSTDPGGAQADLASTAVWSQLIDTSGTPHEQARRLLSLLFPKGCRRILVSRIRRHRGGCACAVIS
jgi:pimeloyl-ACP methyl ester carboxylesterase